MPLELADEQIVEEALLDQERFALLIERYEAKLLRYLERLGIGAREDREDVLQNSFIKAYRNLNSFDLSLSFSSWIYRITHNEAMSFFRARRARPKVALEGETESFLHEIRDESADTAELAEARLSKELLENALAELPDKYRDALMLRFFENRSYTEMSDILEVPVGTVSTLIHRAKAALAKSLATRIHP